VIHFLYVWLGLSNASGSQYLFWSGFFGDVTIFAAIFSIYFKHNCHAKGCPKIGKHLVNGTPYCTKHKEIINE
jgi:hypothetical protein